MMTQRSGNECICRKRQGKEEEKTKACVCVCERDLFLAPLTFFLYSVHPAWKVLLFCRLYMYYGEARVVSVCMCVQFRAKSARSLALRPESDVGMAD